MAVQSQLAEGKESSSDTQKLEDPQSGPPSTFLPFPRQEVLIWKFSKALGQLGEAAPLPCLTLLS